MKKLKAYLYISILSALVGSAIMTIIDYHSWLFLNTVIQNTIYSVCLGLVLYKGNEILYTWIGHKYPWTEKPLITMSLGIACTSIFSFVAFMFINFIWYIYIYENTLENYWIFSIRVSGYLAASIFLISFISHIRSFYESWKTSLLNEEKLKREKIQMQHETLQNQLSPHFLFNSLNALISLIYIDTEKAITFINQLESVYHYVLDQKGKEVVDLKDEFDFVKNYISLQKIRFGENLQVDFNINAALQGKLIPLSLQIIIENAIKHNVISEEKPLKIAIKQIENHLIIKNNLQVKQTSARSSKIGLKNIKSRYELLSQQTFEAFTENDNFIVKLPIIPIKNENSNN